MNQFASFLWIAFVFGQSAFKAVEYIISRHGNLPVFKKVKSLHTSSFAQLIPSIISHSFIETGTLFGIQGKFPGLMELVLNGSALHNTERHWLLTENLVVHVSCLVAH